MQFCFVILTLLTVINVAAHIAYGLTPQPLLSATVASLHPETSPAETRRSHTQSPAKQTHTYKTGTAVWPVLQLEAGLWQNP